MDILAKIIDLRNKKGWTEYKLSLESNVPQTTISSWFRKNVQPSVASLQAICNACGITLSQFFAEEDDLVQLTDCQKKLLEEYAALSQKQQDALLSLLISMRIDS
ncbi:MAG: helix-turn-helix transcriptional regulator [Clostridia bacterium]|nr:helix-turn-helix transcriptional regulator [Clostridia bacterium]